jgi:hypothetical protein
MTKLRDSFDYLKLLLYTLSAILIHEVGHFVTAKLSNANPKIGIFEVNVPANRNSIPLLASGHAANYLSAAILAILAKKFHSRDLAYMSGINAAIPLADAALGFIYKGDFYQLSEKGVPLLASIPVTLGITSLLLYYNCKKEGFGTYQRLKNYVKKK